MNNKKYTKEIDTRVEQIINKYNLTTIKGARDTTAIRSLLDLNSQIYQDLTDFIRFVDECPVKVGESILIGDKNYLVASISPVTFGNEISWKFVELIDALGEITKVSIDELYEKRGVK